MLGDPGQRHDSAHKCARPGSSEGRVRYMSRLFECQQKHVTNHMEMSETWKLTFLLL